LDEIFQSFTPKELVSMFLLTRSVYLFVCIIVQVGMLLVFSGCRSDSVPSVQQPAQEQLSGTIVPLLQREGIVYEDWGIEVKTIMLSAAGYMLDFRFKVLDAQKIEPLFGRKVDPYLIDEASGATLIVPSPPKVGQMRQTLYQPHEGEIHYILFANPGRFIKPGNKVSVVIGDFRAENLTVESYY
jgi:hypothetical protein